MMEILSTSFSAGQGDGPVGRFLVFALLLVLLEYAAGKLAHHDHHDLGETAASVGVALGELFVRLVTAGLVALPFAAVYAARLFDIPMGKAWAWAALFVGVEFCYYWFHRASHRIRWFWATHAVHHSATHFNLSAALRLGWTGQLTGAFVFFLPLAFIGFHPAAIAAIIGLGLIYQFFLHTAYEIWLGPLEWILNTPAHHRVHHASNDACLDRNYGSVLIVFDRLFGTFAEAPKDELLVFGLKGKTVPKNPFAIAFCGWTDLIRDFRRSKGMRRKLAILLGRP